MRITHVLHLAAESHVDRSITGPGDFIQTNIVGTFNLLEAVPRLLVSDESAIRIGKRFPPCLHRRGLWQPRSRPGYFTETTPYAPNSPYSASKASSDFLVRAYHHTYGLPVVTTNCSNNYGPRQFPEKLIPVIIESICHAPVHSRLWRRHERARLALCARSRRGPLAGRSPAAATAKPTTSAATRASRRARRAPRR